MAIAAALMRRFHPFSPISLRMPPLLRSFSSESDVESVDDGNKGVEGPAKEASSELPAKNGSAELPKSVSTSEFFTAKYSAGLCRVFPKLSWGMTADYICRFGPEAWKAAVAALTDDLEALPTATGRKLVDAATGTAVSMGKKILPLTPIPKAFQRKSKIKEEAEATESEIKKEEQKQSSDKASSMIFELANVDVDAFFELFRNKKCNLIVVPFTGELARKKEGDPNKEGEGEGAGGGGDTPMKEG